MQMNLALALALALAFALALVFALALALALATRYVHLEECEDKNNVKVITKPSTNGNMIKSCTTPLYYLKIEFSQQMRIKIALLNLIYKKKTIWKKLFNNRLICIRCALFYKGEIICFFLIFF